VARQIANALTTSDSGTKRCIEVTPSYRHETCAKFGQG
jgi:hypothetical protein